MHNEQEACVLPEQLVMLTKRGHLWAEERQSPQDAHVVVRQFTVLLMANYSNAYNYLFAVDVTSP